MKFPVMKGTARMAIGAGDFEVPLFSQVLDNLWQGCSPAEFPDQFEQFDYDIYNPLLLGLRTSEFDLRGSKCHWLWETGLNNTEDGPVPDPKARPRFDKILNLFPWGEYEVPEGTEMIAVKMFDVHSVPDKEQVDELAFKVIGWLSNGHKVLVHCQAGLNRSSLIVARSLMLGKQMSADEAIKKVRDSRSPVCLCNSTFENFLRSLD